ncbi:WD repeat-containing protein [Multifurca ochricompacta]|uniref:WD repeat-containing protein n=1 Tax=Multifurca ochricompacta TaxID=376703 RepID=A0AAD4QTP3_9AGAM|nr:WD repeat-containing protein [Multifurca ochricompacta]
MLNLVRAFTGSPSSTLHFLRLPTETLLLYSFADTVVILEAISLHLVRALAFSQVFPGRDPTSSRIVSLAVDSALKLVIAASGPRIAVWSLSGVSARTWLVHSSLLLPDGKHITALDCSSGLLAVATQSLLSVYTLVMENDLPAWSFKWSCSSPTLSSVYFSPSLVYLATTFEQAKVVGITLTTSGRQIQTIHHPKAVTNIVWRSAQPSSRDGLVLYTVTCDATLRIFTPVLDSPQYMQLHATLDLSSSRPMEKTASSIFYLNREVLAGALTSVLMDMPDTNEVKIRRVQDILDAGWDMFVQVLPSGSLSVRAVANIDRRPPTLFKQFTLLQDIPVSLPRAPSYLHVVPGPTKHTLALVLASPLSVYVLEPLDFFDSHSDGLTIRRRVHDRVTDEDSRIKRFVRTPDGTGLAVVRETGGDAWIMRNLGTELQHAGRWTAADHVVVLNGGQSFATFSNATCILTLHATPELTLSLPVISSLFSLPPRDAAPYECIYAVTASPTPSICHIHAVSGETPSLSSISQTTLPLPSPAVFIIPVDPMGWISSRDSAGIGHDVLLSVGGDGVLMFWVPDGNGNSWRSTGKVRTGRTNIRMVRCSSAKKTVLVVPRADGEELTIWDSKESEFSSGMEFVKVLGSSDQVNDLDWSSTPDGQSILAVGFAHRVEILCQQRMTYFDEGPGWGVIKTIEVENLLPHPISDSIWLAYGTLLIASGHQMCLYGLPRQPDDEEDGESLFEYVARLNGPLPDYHPQMLLQCLLWDKLDLVKGILVNLSHDVDARRVLQNDTFKSSAVPVDHYFLKKDHTSTPVLKYHRRQHSSLFTNPEETNEADDQGFSRSLIERLLSHLEAAPLPHLTPNEHAHLLVLIQAMLQVDDSRRALDANGFRYLISMRSFYILNERASAPSSPESRGAISRQTGWRARLRYRDIIWAFHSETQGLLLSASLAACQGKMTWNDARALGVFLWLTSVESMRSYMEVIARTEYMVGDARDPVACSLFYFALGKHKLVYGLWRQAAWHKEQAIMLKFMSNDFTQPRWRTAALKNAYALLAKRRFEYAAAFFILGSSLKDAVNVCLRHLDDFQLAVGLARVVEGRDDGPVLRDILNETIIPLAFKKGNRWLGSWAFWLLHRRDLAVRILVTPLQDVASALDIPITELGNPHYDDPSLALLFSQLKSKTLQTAKGTSEISGQAEFNFVLQIARVFTRMGCHALALDLVRSWSFDRPSLATHYPTRQIAPPSPTTTRRMLALEPEMRRRSSIMIDIDLSTAPPTRRPSPEPKAASEVPGLLVKEIIKEEGDFIARKAGLGNLLKTAKQDIQVPEFDINSFF